MADSQKILGIITVSVLVLLILYFGSSGLTRNIGKQPSGVSGDNSTMVFYFDDGRKRTFEGPVSENMTILLALLASEDGGRINLRYSLDKNEAIVLNSIDGHINNMGDKNWSFYLNGEKISTSDINRVGINAGDLIEARYE